LPLAALARIASWGDLRKSDKKVCKYDRPEHEQADVPSKVEGKSGTKHEQHQAQKRLSLFPPADEQTYPKCHQYASRHWTNGSPKVQTATPILPVEMVVFTLSSPSSLSKPRHFG